MSSPSVRKYVSRMILLYVAAILAGAVSGLIAVRMAGFRSPTLRLAAAFAATDAMLAFLLALGIPVIHYFCKNRLTRGEPSKWTVALLAGLIAGVIAGGALLLVNDAGVRPFLLAVAVSLALHAAYATRWKFGPNGFLAATVLLAVAGSLAMEPYTAVFTTLWLVVVAWHDPAWSFARWKSIWPGKASDTAACVLEIGRPSKSQQSTPNDEHRTPNAER